MQDLKEVTKLDIRNKELETSFNNSLKDNSFKNIALSLGLTKKDLIKYTSKIEECVKERNNCLLCKGLYECKNSLNGHIFWPKVLDKKVYFTYISCKYFKQVEKKETNEKSLYNITMKDIDTKDKKQLKVIKWLDEFYEKFDFTKNLKGLYLHGSFGSGKTYLITALLNELKKNKQANISIIYFADALRELKEDWENFSYKMKDFMNVDILLIDDLGAEKVTEWGRDEILGTILQSRMNNNKATFFTSNLTIEELEQHLSLTNGSVDKVKSRRIIERIKQLTIDMELVSENRRN